MIKMRLELEVTWLISDSAQESAKEITMKMEE